VAELGRRPATRGSTATASAPPHPDVAASRLCGRKVYTAPVLATGLTASRGEVADGGCGSAPLIFCNVRNQAALEYYNRCKGAATPRSRFRYDEACAHYRVVTGDVAGSRANYDKHWTTVETARYLPEHVQFREHVRKPHTGDDIVSDPDVVETDGSD
jgi:hypothetical protein